MLPEKTFRPASNLLVWFGLAALAGGAVGPPLAQPPLPGPAPMAMQPSQTAPRVSPLKSPSTGGPAATGCLDLAFFPPAPPPLDVVPSTADSHVQKPDVPQELIALVNEPFYAPLRARLTSPDPRGRLGGWQKQVIETYKANRAAQQIELQARLYTLRESEPAARLQALEAFAREQTPQLVELEQAAKNLRSEFARAGGAGASPCQENPSDSGSSPPGTLAGNAAVLRSAVFYNPDLSPAQRRLVREILVELDDPGRGTGPPGGGRGWMFFPPDTARVHLPFPLPVELAGKIADFQVARDALKRELRGALCGSDTTSSPASRSHALQTLARDQAPRIAAMEMLAEEIRRGLQGLVPDPLGVPRLAPLPAGLDGRIVAYRRAKLDLQKELLTQVRGITARSAGADAQTLQDNLQKAIAAFTRNNAARYAALEKEKEGIRMDLARLGAGRAGEPARSQPADRLIKEFADSFQQYEQWRLFYEYRIAVFEPGLTPEQRRLLFDAGIEKLVPPLQGDGLKPF